MRLWAMFKEGTMTKQIKFNKYNVTDGQKKARVHYSHTTLINGRECVTLYAKDYTNALHEIFAEGYENNTDIMTDYFEKGRVRIYTDNPFFQDARARCN